MIEHPRLSDRHQIVIVGGGAGGIELATRLGKKLGKREQADIMLIDATRTHIWKPLLHEVAAGTLDSHENKLEYLAQANHNYFRFKWGRMCGLDRENKRVILSPMLNDQGEGIIPQRSFVYDTLILAVGSVSHDFNIEGVRTYCTMLDTAAEAERFQKKLLETYVKAHAQDKPIEQSQLHIAIIGAGATGVELAAQLHKVSHLISVYGLDEITSDHVKIHVIEAADHILSGVPLRVSNLVVAELQNIGVVVHTGERVVKVTSEGVVTQNGIIPAAIKVWAAGIKAADFLGDLGLETNAINQLVVKQTLQSTRDDDIFAFGDCAACAWVKNGTTVPPRAQAAHQQASLLVKSVTRKLQGRTLPEYHYKDYGTIVSLGAYSTVGSLMGALKSSVLVEGYFAKFVYWSLYKMHQMAMYGVFRTALLTLSHLFRRSVHAKMKLH